MFVFRSKRADRIKLLVWDQTGMVLVHKRLEGGKFVLPQVRDGVIRMSSAQLAALFEGLDWRLVRPERARRPVAAGRRCGLLVKMDQHGRAPSLISLRIDLALKSADRRGEM
ncbi:MAG: IS66 family insertion sequence element accessory protein TnpB [Alkalilacustris sp.]